MSRAERVARHLKRFLLPYSLLAIAVGLLAGYRFHGVIAGHQKLFKDLIVLFAILTIYPSMVQLRLEGLREAVKRLKPVAISMLLVFGLAPMLAILVAPMLGSKQVSMGFVLANVVPASSASLGYVLICGGSIELATILSILSIIGAFIAIPGYMGLYARLASVHVPMELVMKSLALTLLTPLAAGQLTRYIIIHRRARRIIAGGYAGEHQCLRELRGVHVGSVAELYELLRRVERCLAEKLEAMVKPHLSLWTMATMLILIGLLVANKAMVIVSKPLLALYIFAGQAAVLAALLAVATVADRLAGLSYEDHVAVAFISATKNASVAAAIAVTALTPMAAIPAALIPVIQAPVAIGYVHITPRLEGLFPREAKLPARLAQARRVGEQSSE